MKRLALAISLIAVAAACDSASPPPPTTQSPTPVTSLPPVTTTSTAAVDTTEPDVDGGDTTTTTLPPTYSLTLTVTDDDGNPIPDARVTVGQSVGTTGADGRAGFENILAAPIEVSRFGRLTAVIEWDGTEPTVTSVLQPRVVRGLRASGAVVSDPEKFEALLDLAANSTVNALVFDTKDESSYVLYETESEFAKGIGAINPIYDPEALIAEAKAAGLYTITRIVTFEDDIWVREHPEHKLAGHWADPTNVDGWDYPLGLAEEACMLGFDEIQFDYVRFPAGQTGAAARASKPTTQEERVDTIRDFLTEARDLLHPLGCALSADIFAIVLSFPDDQGIGQMPESVSSVVDALSPMIYPSHYSDGWLGFPDPNDHPGPVVAKALDDGIPRLASFTEMRPWLQAFYYNSSQILTQIEEAETRGAGWILWNARGEYNESWLPPADDS